MNDFTVDFTEHVTARQLIEINNFISEQLTTDRVRYNEKYCVPFTTIRYSPMSLNIITHGVNTIELHGDYGNYEFRIYFDDDGDKITHIEVFVSDLND